MKLQGVTIAFLASTVMAHGSHNDIKKKPDSLSWQNWHMIEEHQLDQYDADSFFKMHDLQYTGSWGREDILNLYGLLRDTIVGDGSGMGEHTHNDQKITKEAKENVVDSILGLMDKDKNGEISLQEWRDFSNAGGELPDFGYGQGHHFDFETEYEEHHWNKYHANNDPDVLIKHKEDIEHELLHHDHEMEETHTISPEIRQITNNYISEIRLENIPAKYRRN